MKAGRPFGVNPNIAPARPSPANWHLRVAVGFLIFSLLLFVLAITHSGEGGGSVEGGGTRTASEIGSFQSLASEIRILDNGHFVLMETLSFRNLQSTGVSGIARIFSSEGLGGADRTFTLRQASRALLAASADPTMKQPEQPIPFRSKVDSPEQKFVTFELGDAQQPLVPGVYQFFVHYEVQPGLQFAAGEAVAQWNVTGAQRRLVVEQVSAVMLLPRGVSPGDVKVRAGIAPAELVEGSPPRFRLEAPGTALLPADVRLSSPAVSGGESVVEVRVHSSSPVQQHDALIIEARWRERTVTVPGQ